MNQSSLKRFLGHPQADLSELTHVIHSDDEAEQNLGAVVFECATVRQRSDIKTSNLIGAFFAGILLAVFVTIAITLLLISLDVIDKLLAGLAVLAGTAVLSPILMALLYWRFQRHSNQFRFDLHERGIRHLKHCWKAEDIVAIRQNSSVQGLDESPAGKVLFLLKPRVKRGMVEMREDTIHLELTDGTKPNLVAVLRGFDSGDVWKLLYRTAKLNRKIRFDASLRDRIKEFIAASKANSDAQSKS